MMKLVMMMMLMTMMKVDGDDEVGHLDVEKLDKCVATFWQDVECLTWQRDFVYVDGEEKKEKKRYTGSRSWNDTF